MQICKVFLPSEYHKVKEDIPLRGFFEKTKDYCTFFITNNEGKDTKEIGRISSVASSRKSPEEPFVDFTINPSCPNILIRSVNVPGATDAEQQVELILYHERNFNYLSKNEIVEAESENDVIKLAHYLKCSRNCSGKLPESKILGIFLMLLLLCGKFLKPLVPKTAVAYHAEEWYESLKKNLQGNGRSWTIAFDVAAGLSIIIWLHRLGNPEEYLLEFAHTVVYYLRGLLTSLRGSPAGLKLNVQLNHFLLKCFIYHVDLWATFLEIVSPALQYLFLPLSILGLCGLSFQLALLSDLLVIITLHAHCFYIYAAVLYRLEIVGICALWRIVLGRRKNVLKNRVESFDYKNSQLYLATLFFASLLFLLPTVLVYYAVFATLRFGTYCITYILLIIRRRILHLPVDTIMRWLFGVYISPENVEVKLLNVECAHVENFQGNITTIYIKPLPSWPRSSITDTQNNDNEYGISQFFIRLIKGQLMGSIQPKYSSNRID